jgi:hypothetical protein
MKRPLLRRLRPGCQRDEWLPRCQGFRVESPEGEVGTVEEVRFRHSGGQPTELAVRGRTFGSHGLAVVPVERVRGIVPAEKRVVLRGRGVRLRSRLLAAAAFAATAASFLLPFLTVTLERRAEATGIDLVRDSPAMTGRYVHDSYVGEVELLVGRGHVPAIVVFSLALAGFLVACVPARKAFACGAVVATAGLAAMWALWETTTPGSLILASSAHRYGFWLAAALFAVSGGAIVRGLRTSRDR